MPDMIILCLFSGSVLIALGFASWLFYWNEREG